MDRNESALALVIASDKVRNVDRLLTLLSPQWGIIKVLVYGAQKSVKAVKAPLYMEGVFNLYHNRERNSYNLVDLTVISAHERLSENLYSNLSAIFLSELVMLERGSDAPSCYKLMTTALDYLEDYNYFHKKTLIQFLLRFMMLSGFGFDYTTCPVCQRPYGEGEILGFDSISVCPCCSNCDTMGMSFSLPPNARYYLRDSLKTDFAHAMEFRISEMQLSRIFRYLVRSFEYCFNVKLNSVQTGLLD